MKVFTYQVILFKTIQAENEEEACCKLDHIDWKMYDVDEDSPRLYEGEYNFNTYQIEGK